MKSSIWGDHLERWFAIIGHKAPSIGTLNLNDLAGSGGRVDVLARAVNTALFVSHGIRNDSHIILHLQGSGEPHRRIWFNGSELRGVRPDERSIAGQIKAIIKHPTPPIGRFVEFSKGILHSGGNMSHTLSEWKDRGVVPVVLDQAGDSKKLPNGKVGFVLSDDSPLTESDWEVLVGELSFSLGERWLQGHSCISILHHLLDNKI